MYLHQIFKDFEFVCVVLMDPAMLLGEIVTTTDQILTAKLRWMVQRLNSRLACRSGVAFCKLPQFSFRHNEFGGATIQTDNNLRKYPHDGLINVFQSGRMNGHLGPEFALVD